MKDSITGLFYLGLIIGILWLSYKGVLWGIDAMRPKTWTLFMYSSQSPNTEYQTDRIDGYDKQTECLEVGLANNKNGSYECGYDCGYRLNKYIETCKKVCGSTGCRN